MPNFCPCCGREFAGPRAKALIIVKDRNLVYYKGRATYLTSSQFAIIVALAEAQGRFLNADYLTDAFEAMFQRDPNKRLINVLIYQARIALKPLGLTISNGGGGVGWTLNFSGKIEIISAPELIEHWIAGETAA